MTAKTVFFTALLWTAFSISAACGQTPGGNLNPLDTLLPAPTGGAPAPDTKAQPSVTPQPSSYIRGDQYQITDCTDGGGGPLGYELFTRIGPSAQIGHGQLADVLQCGLYNSVGGRVLFFDPSQDAAWTVELGLTNIYNHGHGDPEGIALNILVPQASPISGVAATPVLVNLGQNGAPGVTVQRLERTFADLGGGREWYLLGSASCSGPSVRVGCDGGGRYGTEDITFQEIPHRQGTIEGMFASFHVDYECPCCGCCIFQAGIRLEYSFTWSNILQSQNQSDTQDLSILFNFGIRF
jgi:hypothetical protein